MGVSVYIELENPPQEFQVANIDGKALARALPNEDDGSLLAPLLQFVSLIEIQIAEFMDELEEADLPSDYPAPQVQWFEPSQALPAVQNMLQVLRENPPAEIIAQGRHPEFLTRLIVDLEGVESALQLALQHGSRFHIAYDY